MRNNYFFLKLHIIVNLVFYLGIVWTFNLFFKEDNSAVWLVVYLLVIASVLCSAIPDMLINMGVKGIKKSVVRCTAIFKGGMFVFIYTIMNYDNWVYIVAIAGIITVADVPVEMILGKQLRNVNVTVREIISRLDSFGDNGAEKLGKYLCYNILNIGLFINMQESTIETIIFAGLCLAIHYYLSEKLLLVIKQNRQVKVGKTRLIMWLIHCIIMVCSVLEIDSLCYILMGLYWMVITDIAIEKETAVIKINDEQKKE